MLQVIWHFIDISIPWYIKLGIAAVVVGVALAYFHAYWKYILAGAAIIGGGILLNRSKQQGYEQRKADEQQAAQKAETVVNNERQQTQALPDDKLHKETDEWTR